MTQEPMQSIRLSSNLLEHTALLIKMNQLSLSLKWTDKFDHQQLTGWRPF